MVLCHSIASLCRQILSFLQQITAIVVVFQVEDMTVAEVAVATRIGVVITAAVLTAVEARVAVIATEAEITAAVVAVADA